MVGCLEALFACFFPAVLWAIHLEQEQISVTKQPLQGSSATFTCKVFGGSDSTYIHWYRAPAGEAPHRLLYLTLSGSDLNREAGFPSEKFLAYGTQSISNLVVRKLEETDSGRYYCATWDFTRCHKLPAALHKNHHSAVCGAQLSYYGCSRAGNPAPGPGTPAYTTGIASVPRTMASVNSCGFASSREVGVYLVGGTKLTSSVCLPVLAPPLKAEQVIEQSLPN